MLKVCVSFSPQVFFLTIHLAICYPACSFEVIFYIISRDCSSVCRYITAYFVLRQ